MEGEMKPNIKMYGGNSTTKIAEKLILLRKEKGLTQEEVAEIFDISLTAIRNYENINSPRIPKNEILIKMAKFYDVSLEYLLDDTVSNRKQENISLEKDLGLTENTIDSIYDFKSFEQIDIFNEFVSNDIMYNLLPRFKAIKELTSFIYHTKTIILLISDGVEVKDRFDLNYLDEQVTNKFVEYIRDKTLSLKKFIIFFIYRNTSLFDNTKQGTIFKMFDFDKYLSAIFKKISSLDEKFREYREDYNKKDKNWDDLKDIYEKIIREYYIVIFQNLKSLKVGLEAYRDILIYNLSDIFSDYLKNDLLVYNGDFEKIVNKYDSIEKMKITTYSDDEIVFTKEISVKVGDNNVSKRDSKE